MHGFTPSGCTMARSRGAKDEVRRCGVEEHADAQQKDVMIARMTTGLVVTAVIRFHEPVGQIVTRR
jgi:hypothetical protein